MSDRADESTDRRSSGVPAAVAVLVAGAILTLVVVVLLLVTQIPKWTCDPPSHLWVESSDRCIELP